MHYTREPLMHLWVARDSHAYRERAFSMFRRRIGFGESIDTEKVSASMAEGILEIKLPKLEPIPEKKPKKISPQ